MQPLSPKLASKKIWCATYVSLTCLGEKYAVQPLSLELASRKIRCATYVSFTCFGKKSAVQSLSLKLASRRIRLFHLWWGLALPKRLIVLPRCVPMNPHAFHYRCCCCKLRQSASTYRDCWVCSSSTLCSTCRHHLAEFVSRKSRRQSSDG